MKLTAPALASLHAFLTLPFAIAAESLPQSIENVSWGEFSGRIQALSMYRDFDHGNNGHKSTLGTILEFTSPEMSGFDFGAAYNYAFTLLDGGNTALLLNDDINVINEGWLRYQLDAVRLDGSAVCIGRKVTNGEVFRKDDYRQKSRSIESIQFTSTGIESLSLVAGHAIRLSNWIDAGDRWEFNNFGDVFNTGYDTDGVTWIEGVYTGFENWELALFDAFAWDVTHLVGLRVEYQYQPDSTLIGYYRHEGDIGRAADQDADSVAVSYRQQFGELTIEPGYFGVFGDSLRFQEATTGINHPLGVTMLLCGCQFEGGAQTAFIKTSTKLGATTLYGLLSHTWQTDHPFEGSELNLVVSQAIDKNLSVAIKLGLGNEDHQTKANTTFLDSRLFVTYDF